MTSGIEIPAPRTVQIIRHRTHGSGQRHGIGPRVTETARVACHIAHVGTDRRVIGGDRGRQIGNCQCEAGGGNITIAVGRRDRDCLRIIRPVAAIERPAPGAIQVVRDHAQRGGQAAGPQPRDRAGIRRRLAFIHCDRRAVGANGGKRVNRCHCNRQTCKTVRRATNGTVIYFHSDVQYRIRNCIQRDTCG